MSGPGQDPAYGQMSPSDVAGEFNARGFHIDQALALFRTCTIVKVIKVYPNDDSVVPVGTVDVQPLVKIIDGLGTASSHGTIFGLPFFRLQGGIDAVIVDPKPNDLGIAIIADRDISSVKKNKAESTPGSYRIADLADGIYLGGILNAAPTQWIRFVGAGGMEWIDKFGNKIQTLSNGMKLTDMHGNIIDSTSGSWVITGNVEFKNNVIVDGTTSMGPGTKKVVLDGDAVVSGHVVASSTKTTAT